MAEHIFISLAQPMLRQRTSLAQPGGQPVAVCVSAVASPLRCHVVIAPDVQPQAVCRNASSTPVQVRASLARLDLALCCARHSMDGWHVRHAVSALPAGPGCPSAPERWRHVQVRAVSVSDASPVCEAHLAPGQQRHLALLPAGQPAMRLLDEEGKEYSWEGSGGPPWGCQPRPLPAL